MLAALSAPADAAAQFAPEAATRSDTASTAEDVLRVSGEVLLGDAVGIGAVTLTALPVAIGCVLGAGDSCEEVAVATASIVGSLGVAGGVTVVSDAPFGFALLGASAGMGAALVVGVTSEFEEPWLVAMLALPVIGSVIAAELTRDPGGRARADRAALSWGIAPVPSGGAQLGFALRTL